MMSMMMAWMVATLPPCKFMLVSCPMKQSRTVRYACMDIYDIRHDGQLDLVDVLDHFREEDTVSLGNYLFRLLSGQIAPDPSECKY